MTVRPWHKVLILAVALASIAAGFQRREVRRLFINARALCYSCIGLQ